MPASSFILLFTCDPAIKLSSDKMPEYTLKRSVVYYRAHIPFAHTLITRDNSKSPFSLMCMSLDSERKSEYMELPLARLSHFLVPTGSANKLFLGIGYCNIIV